MSYIVFKGIPKSCEQCDIKPEKCPAIQRRVEKMAPGLWIPSNYRHDDCPLVEIKAPHGNLIDAKAFKDYIREGYESVKHLFKDNGEFAKEVTENFCKDIDEQNVIVMAEGSEK